MSGWHSNFAAVVGTSVVTGVPLLSYFVTYANVFNFVTGALLPCSLFFCLAQIKSVLSLAASFSLLWASIFFAEKKYTALFSVLTCLAFF